MKLGDTAKDDCGAYETYVCWFEMDKLPDVD
jgi:hypothetical protein